MHGVEGNDAVWEEHPHFGELSSPSNVETEHQRRRARDEEFQGLMKVVMK